MTQKNKLKRKTSNKKRSLAITIDQDVWHGDECGQHVSLVHLKRSAGHPGNKNLFTVVAEKISYDALKPIEDRMKSRAMGVYIAHDSMGTPRYVGRGNIFARLKKHKKTPTRTNSLFILCNGR